MNKVRLADDACWTLLCVLQDLKLIEINPYITLTLRESEDAIRRMFAATEAHRVSKYA